MQRLLTIHFVFLLFTFLGLNQIPLEFLYSLSLSSFIAMSCALLIGPIAVLKTSKLPSPAWRDMRRVLGIWSAMWICAHLFILWRDKYGFELIKATRDGTAHGWAEFIILHAAFLYIAVMGITSNNFSMRLLGTRWKSLHRGIYPLYPAIACAGIYEILRFDLSEVLALAAGLLGLLVPTLQILARRKYKGNAKTPIEAPV